jgi:ABC-type nitrate/sulfonate/bicarbonate transport system substrate-binding protein
MLATHAAAQPLKVAVISEGTASWPLYVAESKRMFENEGVTVAITVTGSSAHQLEALINGGFDIGFQQSDHVVRAVEKNGSDLFIVMAQAHAPELTLVAAPQIASIADLKGRVIAVDGARSGYALLLRKLLRDNGFAETDYTFKEFGGVKERSDAMRSGAAAASFLNPPFDRNLLAEGFRSIGSTREYFPTYPGSIVATRRSWARDNQTRLVAFIRAFRAAYAWLKDTRNKQDAIAMLPERLHMDAGVASRAYDDLAARPLPQITPDALRQVLDIVWEAERLPGSPAAPERYLDASYLERAAQ